jgi:hypothetical protein
MNTTSTKLVTDPRVRTGKTRRERATGEAKRRAENKALRALYTNDAREKVFPSQTAKGKGNSSKPYKATAGRRVK